MAYADGFLLIVPKKNLDAYKKLARIAGKVWREHGALDYKECAGDDLDNACGRTFPELLKLKPSETAVFSWIVYRSRAHRDRVNDKVMKDPRIAGLDPKSMPFDMKRMSMGGFTVLVSA
jgi:uncharacterized protein YbaA (DUF1428 family)